MTRSTSAVGPLEDGAAAILSGTAVATGSCPNVATIEEKIPASGDKQEATAPLRFIGPFRSLYGK
jgi:hypothetical protein